MAEPARRKRTGTTIISLFLLLVVSARRSENHAGPGSDEGGLSSIVSTLGAIPEVLDEIAQFIDSLRSSRPRRAARVARSGFGRRGISHRPGEVT